MSYLYEERTQPAGISGCWAGLIATSPADVTETVEVTLPGFDATVRFGPCRWQPRVQPQTVDVAETGETAHTVTVAELVLPARGDSCLVCFDDNGDPWVAVWWPA